MLSGSFAMAYYCQPRMTRDLDFVVELNRSSGSTLYEVFKDSYYVSKEAIDEAIIRESMFTMIHTQSIIKVDFIISKLIWMKDSHSELQKSDVTALLLTHYDHEYFDDWISKLDLSSTLGQLRHE